MSKINTSIGHLADKIKQHINKSVADTVEKHVESVPVPADGVDGLGYDVPQWEQGIYRKDSVVQHNFGQCFKALEDTNAKPGSSTAWERLGNNGFRWTGVKQAGFEYKTGDLYIDGGSCFLWTGDKAKMFVQRGKDGTDGKDGKDGKAGKDAPKPAAIQLDKKGLVMVLSDGSTVEGDADIYDTIESVAKEKALLWLEEQYAIEEKIGIRYRLHRGFYEVGESYSVGDTCQFNKGFYICKEADQNSVFLDQSKWVKISAGGGSSGGGGGGAARISTLQIDRLLNMHGLGIQGLGDPRPGRAGKQDAVNRDTMDKAIAAGALYQGIYTVSTDNPDIRTKADAAFTPLVANAEINKPNAAATAPAAGNVMTWHNWKGNGFDMFSATTVAPKRISVMLSDGRIISHNIPTKTYADEAALKSELERLFAGETDIKGFEVYVNGADCHIGVETTPPLYVSAISDETGNAFPVVAPGAGNTILNTYNWIVQTKDENAPEALPAGIPGLPAGTIVKNSDVLQWSGTKNGFEVISGSSLTQNFADQRYWRIDADNMKWADQPYTTGSIVYGASKNAWFTANQNIVAGSPEPGTIAAAAIWRKINSTYGATVFFGKGDYDLSDTTAANNWGMPAGSYPSGQQPLNGDSYFDVLSGSTTSFVVTEGAVTFAITGTFDKTTDLVSEIINVIDLDSWPTLAPAGTPTGKGYYYSAAHAFTGGSFSGTTTAGAFYLVWSGDPDADNDGWLLVNEADFAAGNTFRWSNNTPHPQKAPDTIAASIQYGFERNLKVAIPAGLADGDTVRLVSHILNLTALIHVEVRDTASSGSIYSFDMKLIGTGNASLVPTAVYPDNNHFLALSSTWIDSTNSFVLDAKVKASASGANYVIQMTSQDLDLNVLQAEGVKIATPPATYHSVIKADSKYPSDDLNNFLKAASGDAAALLPPGLTLGANATNHTLQAGAGKMTTISGYWKITALVAGLNSAFIKFKRGSTPIPTADFKDVDGMDISAKGDGIDVVTATDLIPSGAGYLITNLTDIRKDRWARFHVDIDNRSPNMSRIFYQCWYTGTTARYFWYRATFASATAPDNFYFSEWNNNHATWEIYKG